MSTPFRVRHGIIVETNNSNASVITSNNQVLSGSSETPIFDLATTWNTTGNPTAIRLNVTNTASGANSSLMNLQLGGASRFYVAANGNVGVGTNTPNTQLHVVSWSTTPMFESTFSGAPVYLRYRGSVGGPTTWDLGLLGDGSGDFKLKSHFGNTVPFVIENGAANNTFRIKYNTGYVGIGTTDPVSQFDVAGVITSKSGGGALPGVYIYGAYTDASNYERVKFTANATAHYVLGEEAGTGLARPLYLGSNNNVHMTIAANGNIGIGNTSPGSALDVSGIATFRVNPSRNITIQQSATTGQVELHFNNSDANASRIITNQHDLAILPNTGIVRIGSGLGGINGPLKIGILSTSTQYGLYGSTAWGLKSETNIPLAFESGVTDVNTDVFVFNQFNSGGRRLFNVISNTASRFMISSNGNVGISTTSPANLFEVDATTQPKTAVEIKSNSGSSQSYVLRLNRMRNDGLLVPPDGSANFDHTILRIDSASNLNYAYAQEIITAYKGETKVFYVRNDGYLNAPAARITDKLEVKVIYSDDGNSGGDHLLWVSAPQDRLLGLRNQLNFVSYGANTIVMGHASNTFGNFTFNFKANTTGTLSFLSNGSGNLSIGTLASTAKFTVSSGTLPTSQHIYGTYTDASNYERINFTANSSGHYVLGEEGGTGSSRPLNLGANNNILMTIAANGNVGINASNPSEKLVIRGSTENNIIRLSLQNGGGTELLGIGSGADAIANVQSYGTLRLKSAVIGATLAPILFNTGNTDVVTIAANGNVGIGTGSPSFKLDVNGVINSSSSIISNTSIVLRAEKPIIFQRSYVDSFGWGVYAAADNSLTFTTGINGSGTTIATWKDSGNLGINITNPSYRLHVNGDIGIHNAGSLRLLQSNAEVGRLSTNPGEIALIGQETNAFISFYTNAGAGVTERMRLVANGNIGIGTSNPTGLSTGTGKRIIEVAGSGGTANDYGIVTLSNVSDSGNHFAGSLEYKAGTTTYTAIRTQLTAGGGGGSGDLQFYNLHVGSFALKAKLESTGRFNVNNIIVGGGAYGAEHDGLVLYINNTGAGSSERIVFQDYAFNPISVIKNIYPGGTGVGGLSFMTADGAGLVERVRMAANGNIGINLSSPSNGLHIREKDIRVDYDSSSPFYGVSIKKEGYIELRSIFSQNKVFSAIDGGGEIFSINSIDSRNSHIGAHVSIDSRTPIRLGGAGNIVYLGSANSFGVATQTLAVCKMQNNQNGASLLILGGETIGPQTVTGGNVLIAGGNGSGGGNNGNIILAHNGTEIRGNVGIGTASPTQKLHLADGHMLVGGTYGIFFNNASSARIVFDQSQYRIHGIGSTVPIVFLTNDTERMRIANTGNVGIGVSNPLAKLHIEDTIVGTAVRTRVVNLDNTHSNSHTVLQIMSGGSVGGDPHIFFGVNGLGTSGWNLGLDNSDDDKFKISGPFGDIGGLGSADKFVIDASGNIGIGTSSPSARLHVVYNGTDVNGTPGQYISGADRGSFAGFAATATGGKTWAIGSTSDTHSAGGGKFALTLLDTNSTKLVVDADGDLGINTTTPTAKLDVNSDVIRVRTAKTPASPSDTGNQGDICWDANYIYVCTATNTWVRASLGSW